MAELGEQLSEREQEVLEQLVQGAANKIIAANLFISPNTVKVHLRNINTKLGASSRTEASRIALEQGLVTIPGMEAVAEAEPELIETVSEPADIAPINEPQIEEPPLPLKDPIQSETTGRPTWLIAGGTIVILALIGFAIWSFFGPDTPGVVDSAPFEPVQVGDSDSRWFTSRDLPESLSGASAVSIGKDIFVIGGKQSDGTANGDVHVYNTAEQNWWVAETNPNPVYDGSAIHLTGAAAFIVVGGKLSDGNPTDIVSVYNKDENAWGQATPLPRTLSNGLLLSDGALIYHIGGEDVNGPVNEVYFYDPISDLWEGLPPMPEPRSGATGGLVLGSIYVVGGVDSSGKGTSDCLKFSILEQVWSSCASMGNSRANASGSVIRNQIYVVGGETSADFGVRYNPESDIWEQIPQPMVEGLDSSNWTNSAVSIVDSNKIYILGGEFNGTMSPDTYFYSPLIYQSFIPSATNE